jgi:hypothetical protein
MRTAAALLSATVAALAGVVSCASRAPCAPDAPCASSCPRDASRDASGRCACAPGSALLLGACVAPEVGDAYCGPGARYGGAGCSFVPCDEAEALDVDKGSCVRRSFVTSGGCKLPRVAVVESGAERCLPPEATCPRGTRRDRTSCARPRDCPAGSLATRDGCRNVVTGDPSRGTTRVDVGAWVAVVLGADGGRGSPELCAPLALRPGAAGVAKVTGGAVERLELRVRLVIPDADVSRVHAEVVAGRSQSAEHPQQLEGQAALESAEIAVAPLVEALRALGGESSTTEAEADVVCDLAGAVAP